MKIIIIGTGAISTFVRDQIVGHDIKIVGYLVRPGKERIDDDATPYASSVAELPTGIDLLVDCAGHEGLREHGSKALEAGIDVLTISIGALADQELEAKLTDAATKGNSKLHLASGAIGALDALRAARSSSLTHVKYIGRKPPEGWKGSLAEDKLDLANLSKAEIHFTGSAREAAVAYPKNANVAAAVALSSLGFDETQVELIADPSVTANIHEIYASGDFGEMRFSVSGNSLPDNPRSSALAAMSVVASIMEYRKQIGF